MRRTWTVTYDNPQDSTKAFLLNTMNYPFIVQAMSVVNNMLIILNVPNAYQEEDLRTIFQNYGRVDEVAPLGFPTPFDKRTDYTVYLNYSKGMFSQLWPSGLFSDVVLKMNNRDFKVHRAVLTAVSPYFMNLFTQMREAAQSQIELTGIDPFIFEKLLELIYTGSLPITDLTILKVLQLVQYFQITSVDIEEVIAKIPYSMVGPKNFSEYIAGVSQLYPEGFTSDIIELVRAHVNPRIDISFLSEELQTALR